MSVANPDAALRRLRRRERLRHAAVVLVCLGLAAATVWRAAQRGEARRFDWDERPLRAVARVVDGDMLLLESGHRVRLLGVDTPETKHPDRPPEPWGEEASAFTRELIGEHPVRLHFDREKRDRYDRVLAWVWAGESQDRLLNVALVEAGLSEAVLLSPLRPDYRKQLIEAEKQAKGVGRGVWSNEPAGDGMKSGE